MTRHPLLERLLEQMAASGGSDLHIKSDAEARMRLSGEIVTLKEAFVDAVTMEEIAAVLAGADGFARLQQGARGVDGYYLQRDGTRYRVNLFLHVKGVAAVLRVIAHACKTLEALGLPGSVEDLTRLERGLVLVTGTTGSGKSTTLASMIDRINRCSSRHIITIEDPVEFIHTDARCIIEQRNIGEHVEDFPSALKDALREDPDIILVGEMRDIETIRMALHAANTGHLVFSTLHTLDAKETVSRIISVFAAEEQNQVRTSLASVLQGVVSQRLIKTGTGGLAAAVEVMRGSERVRQMIMEGRENELLDVIEEGGTHGMQSFDQSLLQLYAAGRIDAQSALEQATRPSDLSIVLSSHRPEPVSEIIGLKVQLSAACEPVREEPSAEPEERVNLLKRFK